MLAYEILPRKAGEAVIAGVIHADAVTGVEKETSKSFEQFFKPGKVTLIKGSSTKSTAREKIDAARRVWINTPALWGLGAIDRLQVQDLPVKRGLPAGTARRPAEVSGRHRVLADGRIGKFGWKGQFGTLKDFVAAACAGEVGLSNASAQQILPGGFHPDPQAQPDLSEEQVQAMVQFIASLPEPTLILPQDPLELVSVHQGEELMVRIGCTECHTRHIGKVQDVYSDYQLHQVEDSTTRVEGYYIPETKLEYEPPPDYPQLTEWRTPALWGVADTAPYWHDGSARTLTEAIVRHAREANKSVTHFLTLSSEQQQSVIAFLKCLRAPATLQLTAPKPSTPKPSARGSKTLSSAQVP